MHSFYSCLLVFFFQLVNAQDYALAHDECLAANWAFARDGNRELHRFIRSSCFFRAFRSFCSSFSTSCQYRDSLFS